MTVRSNFEAKRIVCLSNVFDEHYLQARGECVDSSLTAVKRRNLFSGLEKASGRPVIVLSSPPKATERRNARWLPALATSFGPYPQFFCPNLDAPKLRIPLSWLFYAWHVARQTRSGDLIVIDNFELIYVLAAWFARLLRNVRFILDYEDGKHLIDRGIWRVFSRAAEVAGRPLLGAAIVAHPALARRLDLPSELVPGFVDEQETNKPTVPEGIQFLYSGSLDAPRGIDLLMDALSLLPNGGWRLDISGSGPRADAVREFASEPKWRSRVTFHGVMPEDKYLELLSVCQVGLNCQRSTDAISYVTFPSKVFTYLSAGMLVISTRASEVESICQSACLYYDDDTSASLAHLINEVISNYQACRARLNLEYVRKRYSLDATAQRLRSLLERTRLI